MRPEDIDAIVIHCSATPEGKDFRAADIDIMHKERGFSGIGYNFVIDIDGTVEVGRPLTQSGAHCNEKGFSGKSYNLHSIGICYIGGLEAATDKKGQIIAKLDKNGKPIPKDTRTPEQKKAMAELVYNLVEKYPITDILGHRDTSPDKNHDGKITKNEWVKSCPCFDVRSEFPIAVCTAKRK